MAYISADELISIIPSVLTAGGTGTTLNGLLLVEDDRVPIGDVISFGSLPAGETYFGAGSNVAAAMAVYFGGFTGCTQLPSALLVARYPIAPVAAWLRGGSVAALTLAALQALTGTLTLTIDGIVETSSTINLSSATSFSNAATIIQAAFAALELAVTYDSVLGAFLFTTAATGTTATIGYATTDSLATSLCLTQATGATLSQGASAATPAAFMAGIVAQTTNWATFGHLFDPDGGEGNSQKLAFAVWANGQKNRYAYFPFDNDVTTTEANGTSCLGYLVTKTPYSGTSVFYETAGTRFYYDIFAMSIAASLDTDVANGSTDFAFRSQSGLVPDVSAALTAENIIANGANFYGAYAASNVTGEFLYPGQIGGAYSWIDQYVEQIWLNSYMQQVLFTLPQTVKKIPFNQPGAALIETALVGTAQAPGPIDQAITFGAIEPGAELSSSQVVSINQATGTTTAASSVMTQGWYLQVPIPAAAVRAARGPWPILFYYTSGGSVHTIDLSSTLVA